MPDNPELRKALARVEREIEELSDKLGKIKTQRPAEWSRRRATLTKPLYDLYERRWALELLRRASTSGVLIHAEVRGILRPLTVQGGVTQNPFVSTDVMTKNGLMPKRTYDVFQYDKLDPNTQPHELKSDPLKRGKGVLASSVKGGINDGDLLGHFRVGASPEKQIWAERSLITEALKVPGSKIVIRGVHPLTGALVRLEIDPLGLNLSHFHDYKSAPSRFDITRPDHTDTVLSTDDTMKRKDALREKDERREKREAKKKTEAKKPEPPATPPPTAKKTTHSAVESRSIEGDSRAVEKRGTGGSGPAPSTVARGGKLTPSRVQISTDPGGAMARGRIRGSVVGGRAFMTYGNQLKNMSGQAMQEMESAVAQLSYKIQNYRSQGEYVMISVTFAVPKTQDVFGLEGDSYPIFWGAELTHTRPVPNAKTGSFDDRLTLRILERAHDSYSERIQNDTRPKKLPPGRRLERSVYAIYPPELPASLPEGIGSPFWIYRYERARDERRGITGRCTPSSPSVP
jgi:hypothetical protein